MALKETSVGWQIYNPRFEGPNSKLNVSLDNLKPMKQKADLVLDPKTNRSYLITPDKNIISLTSGKIMKWAKNNGDRVRILNLVGEESIMPDNNLTAGQTLTGLTFNDGQATAITKIKEFLNSDDQMFILEGKAGTGKTTLLKEVLLNWQKNPENNGKNILVGALSWKATNVLESSLGGKPKLKFDKNSLAGMLDMRYNEATGKMTRARYSTKGRKIGKADLIVVDEASMLNEQALQEIQKALRKNPDAKVIFAGDIGQLPPIREKTDVSAGLDSPVFEIENKARLVERVRQGEESPILPYADFYWNNATSGGAVSDPAEGARRSITQQEGQLLFTEQSTAIEIAIEEYKKDLKSGDGNLIKYVTYENARRNAVNKTIHESIFGKDANFYAPGTPIVFNNNHEMGTFSFTNSDEAVVEEIIGFGEDDRGVPFVKLKINSEIHGKYEIEAVDYNKVPLPTKQNPGKYQRGIEKLRGSYNKAKASGDVYEREIALERLKAYSRKYAPISQAYAITSHKSQGSTYNTVIVDEVDIYGNVFLTNKARSNSMYTAITRAKNNVLIVSDKTTPYQGKITLLDDTAIQIDNNKGIDTKLAKFYESLTEAQLKKLDNITLEDLQQKFDNLAFADPENAYTIDDFILDQTDKCKI